MSTAFTSQFFRSCTTSLSSRTLSRSAALRRSGPSIVSRRHYSDKPTSEDAAGKTEGKEESKEEVKPLSPEAEKLKAKEAEVVDLTVCITFHLWPKFLDTNRLLQGRLRYLQADFLNLQRNAAREKEQTRDFAITRFASDLLETVDVLSMALKSVPPSALAPSDTQTPPSETPSSSSESDSSSPPPPTTKSPEDYLRELYTGVELTQRQLLGTLFKYHVKPFDPIGDKFDPNRHEALYQAPVPDKTPGSVIQTEKIGYTIKDRVLRAAQVGVAQDSS